MKHRDLHSYLLNFIKKIYWKLKEFVSIYDKALMILNSQTWPSTDFFFGVQKCMFWGFFKGEG